MNRPATPDGTSSTLAARPITQRRHKRPDMTRDDKLRIKTLRNDSKLTYQQIRDLLPQFSYRQIQLACDPSYLTPRKRKESFPLPLPRRKQDITSHPETFSDSTDVDVWLGTVTASH